MKRSISTRPDVTGEGGYTLVETAIALVIATLVVAAGYASYVFMQRIIADWQHGVLVENAAHRIVRDVTRQIRRSEASPATSRGVLELKPNAGMMRYRLRDQALIRNGRPMHTAAVRVLAFEVSTFDGRTFEGSTPPGRTHDGPHTPPACGLSAGPDASAVASGDPPDEAVRSENHDLARATRQVHLRLRLAARRDTIDVCTAVQPRQSSSWL